MVTTLPYRLFHRPIDRRPPNIIVPAPPVVHFPDITAAQIGPIAPPAQPKYHLPPIREGMIPHPRKFSAEDIGPIDFPDVPDWVKKEAQPQVPLTQIPQMPDDIMEEARYGIKVVPQDPDYIPPPVANTYDPAAFPMDDTTDEMLMSMIGDDIVKLKDIEIRDFDLDSKDFGNEVFNELDGLSRFQQFGTNSGRSVK